MGNIPNRLDRLPVSGIHWKIFMIGAVGWMFDSIDLAMLSYALPDLSEYFGLTKVQGGLVATLTFLGMFFGAFLGGRLADRYGRKPVFAWTLIFYSVASLLSGLAWNFESLLVFRFLLGLGMGAEFPVIIAYISEFMPAKKRGALTNLMEGFWPVGVLLAVVLSRLLIPDFGWRSVFIVMVLPALYVTFIRRHLPESPRWLEMVGRHEEADAVVTMMEKSIERKGIVLEPVKPSAAAPIQTKKPETIPISALFNQTYIKRTVMLTLFMFTFYFAYYAINTWLPTIINEKGYDIVKTFNYFIIMTLWGIPGFISTYFLVEKWGRKPSMFVYGVITILSVIYMVTANSTTEILIGGSILNFFYFGWICLLYAYVPEQYPTSLRGTGAGLAWSIGRAGSLMGPYVAAVLLGTIGASGVLYLGAGAAILAVLIVALLGEETKGKSLEDLNEAQEDAESSSMQTVNL